MMQHWISSVLGTGRTAKRAPSPVGELGQHIPPIRDTACHSDIAGF